jgi:N-methylhydantoinase B
MKSPGQRHRIVTDLVWQRLIALLEDQALTLIRTSFSTTTRESGDLSAGLFDRRSRMLAQAVTGTPGHVNSMALAVESFLQQFPLDSLSPGDVLASNDPWICSGHLHDFTLVTPIFHHGRAVGAVANTVHVADIGGLGFGASARDLYEEGLRVPVCKLAEGGVMNRLLLDLLRANVREPDQVIGDLYSSVAGNQVAEKRVMELLHEFELADLEAISDAIIERTRTTVEQRIAALPDGEYRSELVMDGYDAPVTLKLCLGIRGPAMTLDFAGTSASLPRGVNVVLNYTKAYSVFGVNCLLNADIPCNHGSLEPITVTAPAGSILNTQPPAAVSARHMIGHMLPDLVFGALAQVMPVPAEGAGLIWNPSLRGRGRNGEPFSTVTFNAGGAGAQADRDGWSATAFPSGVKSMPVEAIEASAPVRVLRKSLRTDSGGAGRFRGGLGQVIEIIGDADQPVLVNAMFDRLEHPALGREGGLAGAAGQVRTGLGRELQGKGLQELAPGESLVLELPGGGGYGNPALRVQEAVTEDLRQGYISIQSAKRDYGYKADD